MNAPQEQSQAGIPILPEEQSVYFNGFAIAVGVGDVVVTLMRNGVPTITLNASFTVAKTFAAQIAQGIKSLEEHSQHTIMTVEDVQNSIQSHGRQ